MHDGIAFALANLASGEIAGWAAGTEADQLPYQERAAFLAGVRQVEDLSFEQQLIARRLWDGGANAADAAHLPMPIVIVLRKRNTTLDFMLALVERGEATLFPPPYDSEVR